MKLLNTNENERDMLQLWMTHSRKFANVPFAVTLAYTSGYTEYIEYEDE